MTDTPRIDYYLVRYNLDGQLRPDSRVAITEGYTTFESIRTILAVKATGRQEPERVEIVSVQRVPGPEDEAALAAILAAHKEGQAG